MRCYMERERYGVKGHQGARHMNEERGDPLAPAEVMWNEVILPT